MNKENHTLGISLILRVLATTCVCSQTGQLYESENLILGQADKYFSPEAKGNVDYAADKDAYTVHVTKVSGLPAGVQLSWPIDAASIAGKRVRVSLEACSENEVASLNLAIRPKALPAKSVGFEKTILAPRDWNWHPFRFEFVMPTITEALTFAVWAGKQSETVGLRNVSVRVLSMENLKPAVGKGMISLLDSGADKWQSIYGAPVSVKNMRGGGSYQLFKSGEMTVGVGFSAANLPQLLTVSLSNSKKFEDVAKAAGLPKSARLGAKYSDGIFTQVDMSGVNGWAVKFVESDPKAGGDLIFSR